MRLFGTLPRSEIKSAMQWGGSGAYGGGWGQFDKLTDPWPRTAKYDAQKLAGAWYLNAVVASCIAWMQKAFTAPTLEVHTVDGDELVDGHALVKLFRRPNPHFSGSRLWQNVLSDYMWSGNGYLRKERTNGGEVGKLWHIPCGQLKPDWPKGAKSSVFISRYIYSVGGAEEQIPPEDIIHFRFGQDPDNTRLGWSPLRAGVRELAVLNSGAEYRGALLQNMGTPPYVATPKDPARVVTEEIANRFRELWARLTGGANRGSLMMPTIPMDFERIGFSPAELDIVEMLAWDADMICSLMGLSSMVLALPSGAKSRTFSNYEQADAAAVEHNLVPTLTVFAEDLDVQLLPDLGNPDTERCVWNYSKVTCLQEDEHKKWLRVIQATEKGILTVNEARDRLDTTLPDLEEPEPPPPALVPESTGDAAALAEGQQPPPAALNGAGITAGRFKALASAWSGDASD